MKRIMKIIFCLFLIYITAFYVKDNLALETDGLLSFIINNNSYSSASKSNQIIKRVFNILAKKNVLDPNSTLDNSILDIKEIPFNIPSDNNDEAIIYLYSTHQTEEYQTLKNELYNFTPTVMTTSYILEDLLEEKGFKVIVEEKSVKKVLAERKWDYSYSYRISREYMEQAKKDNPSLKYFIDIHRDAVFDKSISTKSINGSNYAKIMFLLGQNRDNYENNLAIVKKLEADLNKNYEGITRNTYFQKSYTYNQDFSDDTFLIEVGTTHNTIDEVYNSMVALADTLERYIGGKL